MLTGLVRFEDKDVKERFGMAAGTDG